MQKRLLAILVSLFVLVFLCVAGASYYYITKYRRPQAPVAPALISPTVQTLVDFSPSQPLVLAFSQPMDRPSTEAAISIEPKVPLQITWQDDRTLQVSFSGLQRAMTYTLSVGETAKSTRGLAIARPINITLLTQGNLEVSTVQPAADAKEVALDSSITIVFNRPVVPLGSKLDQASLPQPLQLEPAVDGRGEWLDTSIYRFTPTSGLAPSTRYQASVKAISGASGTMMASPFAWSFTTVPPQVKSFLPATQSQEGAPVPAAKPTDPIEIEFAQPMDQASVEAALTVTVQRESTAKVQGRIRWAGNNLVFTPIEPWPRGANVAVSLKGAKAQGGAVLSDMSWNFHVMDPMGLASSDPGDGAQGVSPGSGLRLVFTAPVDEKTLEKGLKVEPDPGQVNFYWQDETSAYVNFDSKAATTYTVTIPADVKDITGLRLGGDIKLTFTTGDYAPSLMLLDSWHPWAYGDKEEVKAYISYRNISSMSLELSRLTAANFIRLSGDDYNFQQSYEPAPDEVLRQWSVKATAGRNQSGYEVMPLAEGGGPLPPGLYYLSVSSPETIAASGKGGGQHQVIVVSSQNVTFKRATGQGLVWVTGWNDGQPQANLPVQLLDAQGEVTDSGTTGADGVFQGKLTQQDPWRPFYAFVGTLGSTDFGLASSNWNNGIDPWKYNISMYSNQSPYTVYIYTDRQIYRPGQTVYYKCIARMDDDARYSLPVGMPQLQLTVTDAQGQQILQQALAFNDMGTCNGSLTLANDAPLGIYNLWVNDPKAKDSYNGFGASFQVAEYKRPDFQVSVASDKPEYIQGDTIQVSVESSYYFGGPVADAGVHWTVMSEDYFFRYQGVGWWDFTDYDYLQQRAGGGPFGETLGEGDGKTDANGRFSFSVPADIAQRTLSQTFTIEATITDVNNQAVSSRLSVVVHKGEFYIGLQPASYVSQAGKESQVNVLTVDTSAQPAGGKTVDVTFYEHRWYNAREQVDGGYQWKTTEENIEVGKQTITTDADGKGSATFTPRNPGSYMIVAIGKDSRGNEVRSSTYLWVTGEGYVSWAVQQDNTIQLIPDQKSYKVGDTARILIPSPYSGQVKALFTSERGKVLQYRVLDVQSSSQVVEVPITADMAPNVYFVAVLVRGASEDASLPPFQIGYAQASVAIDQLEVQLSLEPSRPGHYQPGDTATFNITAKDSQGKPVQAELSLDMVDKSVQALSSIPPSSIVDFFYSERSLGVQTAATLTLSTSALSASLPAGKGGGGGGPGEGVVRQRFPETAYWEPALRTDAEGKASVSIVLPDNLTTWSLEAKAVTSDTLVAQKTVEIVATKDLLLQPVLPRFLTVGDKALIGAVVHNNTKASQSVDVSCQAEGLEGSLAPQKVTIEAGGKAVVSWQVQAPNAMATSVTLSARAGDLSDAVKQALPVYPLTVAEVVATSGQVGPGESRSESVVLPGRYHQGDLTVQVDASLAAGMLPGLMYLQQYPYGCTEQTLSRFLPNVVTAAALRQLGVENSTLEQGLKDQVSVGLQRLYNLQHDDGGWGWWYADASDPGLTAYVVFGMVQARDAGYSVDSSVIDRGAAYLVAALHRTGKAAAAITPDTSAYIAYVLVEAGQGDLGASVSLFEKRNELHNRGRAYLLMALSMLNASESSRLDALVSDLQASAKVTATTAHWEDPLQWRDMGSDVATTAVVVEALSKVRKDDQLLPAAVRWLMAARQEGHWASTYETATTILGLTQWMVASGELKSDYAWDVSLNGKRQVSGTYGPDNVTQEQTLQIAIAKLLAGGPNVVSFDRHPATKGGADTGTMYYSLALRYYPPSEEIRPVDAGIIVARQYTAAADSSRTVDSATVNDMVRVKLTIIAPTDLYHVVVEDPFPAGCEGVDTSLRTTTAAGVQPQLVAKDDPWGWWWFSHSEIRDDKAVLFASYLPKGTYEYTYYIRASVPGEYSVRPLSAYQMYFPDVFGHSDGMHFTVKAAGQ